MASPRPKPAALKKLHGSEEPVSPIEPIPEGDLTENPEPPEHFTPEQREIWEEAVQRSPPGMLKLIDRSVFETWAVAYALHRAATAAQSKQGLLAMNGTQVVPSPYLAIINRAAATLIKCAAELGFSPTSRPRIYAIGPQKHLNRAIHAGAKDIAKRSLTAYLASAPQSQQAH
jgi:P27 family predicted phage terminase small subunit